LGRVRPHFAVATLVAATVAASTCGADVADGKGAALSGRILITKKLTKERATAGIPGYHRGAAVAPSSNSEPDFVVAELRRAAIYVESRTPLPSRPVTVEIQQENRTFLPETVVVPVGSTVSFPNLDPIFHNVFSLSKPQAFDLGNYPRNETRTVEFRKAGIVQVYCHLHANMRATIVVAPSSWATSPAEDGSYVLPPLPPGDYTVVVWHRSAGYFRKAIQVGEGPLAPLDFVIPVDPEGAKP
jgi:plastocyanin